MAHNPLKIAIVGGGIAGLTLALNLNKLVPKHRRYFDIDIYDSAGSLKAQVGAGIALWPFTWPILEELGLVEEIYRHTPDRQSTGPGWYTIHGPAIFSDTSPAPVFQPRQGDTTPGQDLFTLMSPSGNTITIHRGDFQAILLNNLPDSIRVHTKKRLDTYDQSENGVVLRFEDGTTAEADIVIGADGLQSRVRRKLVEEVTGATVDSKGLHPADARWTGLLTYRTLIRKEKFLEQGAPDHRALREFSYYVGRIGGLVCYPVSNGVSVNFLGHRHFPEYEGTRFSEEVMEKILRDEGYERPKTDPTNIPAAPAHENVASGDVWSENSVGLTANGKRARWFTRVNPEEVKHVWRNWEPEAQTVLNGIESPVCWAVHAAPELETFSHKRVCLLGDAAHAMHPNHGTGAGSAIFDGYVLAHLFASAIATDPSKLASKGDVILDIYDKIRRPNCRAIAAAARASVYHLTLKIQEGTRENEIWRSLDMTKEDVKKLQDHMERGFSYGYDTKLASNEVTEALEMLRERY